MDKSKYILLEWVLEKKYSVVKRDQIVKTEDKEKNDDDLIGTQIMVAWKSKFYEALIIQCGGKIDMNHELRVLTKEQKLAKPNLRPQVRSDVRDNINNVLYAVDLQPGNHQLKISELEVQLSAATERSEKYKNKYKNLKRKYDQVKENISYESQREEISGEVTLPKCQLEAILALSDSAEKLARNLMGALYREDEMKGHSLFGIPCNAHLGSPVRPAIDPVRRNAIILYVMKKYGRQVEIQSGKAKDQLQTSVLRSMGDHLRYLIRRDKQGE